jgi:hypothetical protein
MWPSGFRGEDFLEINNRNLVGSIYGRSSINIAYFVLIREQTWPPQAILVFDCNIYRGPSIDASYQVSVYVKS